MKHTNDIDTFVLCAACGQRINQHPPGTTKRAKLADAAPDLLAALQWVTDRLETVCPDADGKVYPADRKRIAQARAAIAKATA